jgi:hypothetical protein
LNRRFEDQGLPKNRAPPSGRTRATGSAPAGVTGVSYRLDSQDSVCITRFGLNYRWGCRRMRTVPTPPVQPNSVFCDEKVVVVAETSSKKVQLRSKFA